MSIPGTVLPPGYSLWLFSYKPFMWCCSDARLRHYYFCIFRSRSHSDTRLAPVLLFLQFPLEESFRHSFGTQYFILVYFYPYVCIMASRIFSWRMYVRLLNLEYVGYIIPMFLMFASTFKRTHWLVPGYCLGQISCAEKSVTSSAPEPTQCCQQPREDRSYPGQLFLWEMESHRRRCFQPLPPSTIRNQVLYSQA